MGAGVYESGWACTWPPGLAGRVELREGLLVCELCEFVEATFVLGNGLWG